MKTRRLVLLFSIILCLCMLVACSAEVAEQKAEEQLAYATFKNDAKDFSISYDGYKSFDNLYWYYKANKLDAYGKSGDTGTLYAKVPGNSQTGGKGLDGKTEALSEGKWQFTLMAFVTELDETSTGSKRYDAASSAASAIYSGSTPGASEEGIIVIRRNQTNYIPVTVTPVAKKGHIQFKNAYYEWEEAGSVSDPNVKITINLSAMIDEQPVVYEVTNVLSYGTSNYPISGYIWVNGSTGTIADATPGSGYSNEIPAGVYAASIEITPVGNDDNIIFADQNLSLKVFGGLTATISGSLKELLSLDNYFAVPEVDVKVFNPDPTSEAGTVITSNYVAKDEKTSETTTVTFPQGALTSTNQHSLEVEVFSAAVSESKFVIETETTGSQAVAGLDLTLKKVTRTSEGAVTEETVEEFENSKYATIVTYINPGLEDVAVKYNGTDKDQPIATDEEVQDKTIAKVLSSDSGLGYNPSTGYLSFKTNHFSEYYVQATVYAQNVTTGVFYYSLQDAIDDAQESQTVKVLKGINLGTTGLTITGKDLTLDLNGKTITGAVNGKLVTIVATASATIMNSSDLSTGHIYNTDATAQGHDAVCNYGTLTINGGEFGNSDTNRGAGFRNLGTATINGGLYHGYKIGSGYAYAIITGDDDVDAVLTINNATVRGAANGGIAHNAGTMVINNADVLIENSDGYYAVWVTNNGTVTNVEINGGSFIGTKYGLNADVDDDQRDSSNVNVRINGGTFIGSEYGAVAMGNSGVHEWGMTITGGTYSSDPSAYVAEGYVATKSNDKWVVVSAVCCIIRNEEVTYYASLDEALSATSSGDTLMLLKDVSYPTAIMISVNLTIDGNNKKLTFGTAATRGIRINTGNVHFTLKNITIKGDKLERAVQVDGGKDNIVLEIDNCDLQDSINYTINVCNDVDNLTLIVKDSTVKGWGAVNLWGNSGTVTLTNSTFIGLNDKKYNADGWNNFGTIILEGDTTGQTEMSSTAYQVTISNCTVRAYATTGNQQCHILFNSQSNHNEVSVQNCSFKDNGASDVELRFIKNGTYNTLIVDGVPKN